MFLLSGRPARAPGKMSPEPSDNSAASCNTSRARFHHGTGPIARLKSRYRHARFHESRRALQEHLAHRRAVELLRAERARQSGAGAPSALRAGSRGTRPARPRIPPSPDSRRALRRPATPQAIPRPPRTAVAARTGSRCPRSRVPASQGPPRTRRTRVHALGAHARRTSPCRRQCRQVIGFLGPGLLVQSIP